ncbi:MAG: hypothetical protein AB7G13_27380 [Lautropia sp.]
MTKRHAIVWLDHHEARVLQFDADSVDTTRVASHAHNTRQHGSTVRTEHEFFADVCAALADIPEILVAGSKTALADMHHYADKHRPETSRRIVGYEVVDHPSDNQLVAMARAFFLKFDRMAGSPTPT